MLLGAWLQTLCLLAVVAQALPVGSKCSGSLPNGMTADGSLACVVNLTTQGVSVDYNGPADAILPPHPGFCLQGFRGDFCNVTDCEPGLGFLPCSETWGGNLFLMVVYGMVLLAGAKLISDGSELLLEILDPGLIGGLVLPILGAVPDSAIIVVSGMNPSSAVAQQQLAIGVGTLAGSTIMLLTIAWGGSLMIGRVDLGPSGHGEPRKGKDKSLTRDAPDLKTGSLVRVRNSAATSSVTDSDSHGYEALLVDRQGEHTWDVQRMGPHGALESQQGVQISEMTDLSSRFMGIDWSTTGVTTNDMTAINAKIMMMTSIVYVIVEIPLMITHNHSGEPDHVLAKNIALAGMILCFVFLAAYCVFQVVSPSVQDAKTQARRQMAIKFRMRAQVMKMAARASNVGLAMQDNNAGGTPKIGEEMLLRAFNTFDLDNSGQIDSANLKNCIKMFGFEPKDTDMAFIMKDFDADHDGQISRTEFVQAMHAWMQQTAGISKDQISHHVTKALLADQEDADGDDDDDEDGEGAGGWMILQCFSTEMQIAIQASCLMLFGTGMVCLFSDPMVDAIDNFAREIKVKPFFVSFVVTPLASNASELVSSLIFASKKRKKNISLTFCQVYGAVTMNNTMCLGIFLALVYFRDLKWEYTAEVIAIIVSTFAIGMLSTGIRCAKDRVTFPTWMAPTSLLIYPLSLILIIVLEAPPFNLK